MLFIEYPKCSTCIKARKYLDQLGLEYTKRHIVDEKLNKEESGLFIYNLGTGEGYSVLDMIHAFENANHVSVPYKIEARRPGDIAKCYADSSKAEKELNWKATLTLEDMCKDAYNFTKNRKEK